MSFYDEMRGIASELLSEFDQSNKTGAEDDGLWYVETLPGTGPADEPGQGSTIKQKLDGASRGATAEFIDGANIVKGDLQGVFAVVDGFTPTENGYIKADGRSYKIVRIDPIPPTGDLVAWRIFFRKGGK